jgi:hypothetical protein
MSDDAGTGRYLRLMVELTVEVLDPDALQAAALAEIRDPEADLDESERQEQTDLVRTDESGATALQWLIDPDHVLGLVQHIDMVEPREAMLGVEPSEGLMEDEEEMDQ